MALDQNLALEAIALRRVGAGVKQISIAAEDFAIAEHDHAAALADAPILQADMDRIQTVLHDEAGYDIRHSGAGGAVMPKRGTQRQRGRLTADVVRNAEQFGHTA